MSKLLYLFLWPIFGSLPTVCLANKNWSFMEATVSSPTFFHTLLSHRFCSWVVPWLSNHMTSCPRAETLLEHFWNLCVHTLVVENAMGAQQFLDEWKSRSSWQASIPFLHGRNLHITHVEIDTLAVRSFPASALLLSSRVTIFSFNKNQTILSWKEIGFIFNKKSELEAYIYIFSPECNNGTSKALHYTSHVRENKAFR